MSQREMWKTLHLLHLYGEVEPDGRPKLSRQVLRAAGVFCESDTFAPLFISGAVEGQADDVYLSKAALKLLEVCVVANRRIDVADMRVDYPQAFVIMPFSEVWSDDVYAQMIKPAVEAAGLECLRGDTIVREAALSDNILNAIIKAGLTIADLSAANVNVYYEVGLTHALGKDPLLLKEKNALLPADFRGAHYTEYELGALDVGRSRLQAEIEKWAAEFCFAGVAALKNPRVVPAGPA